MSDPSNPQPDQTLPEEPPVELDEQGNPKPVAPDQTLPTEQPPRGAGDNRGRSGEAPGHNKPEPEELLGPCGGRGRK